MTGSESLDPGPRLSRRRLLLGAGTLGAAGLVTLGGIAVVGSHRGSLPAALAANLASLPDADRWRRVGALVDGAGELDGPLDSLTAAVAPDGTADATAWCTRTHPGTIRRHTAEAAAEDFRLGAVVEVDGWRLGRTEAALALLVARS